MKRYVFPVFLILSLMLSLLSSAFSVKAADDPFPSADNDGDGLSNGVETAGWYNLSGGPYVTDPNEADTDHDGLTDGQEKLFNTNPLDPHDPGIFVKYESRFKTSEYYSTTDPDYLKMVQGGDQYLLTEAAVIRRGTTFNIGGTASGTLTISGTGLTPLYPVRDPAKGGWTVSVPLNAKTGAYTATITDGAWTKSMPIYVIFELASGATPAQIAAFQYDDDPANKRDEVAVIWGMTAWSYYANEVSSPQPCLPTDAVCSNWQYHYGFGYAQAFWTEQFKKKVFVDHAIKAINGYSDQFSAAQAIGDWADREFRVNYSGFQNSWSTAMNRWVDSTGQLTMFGGGCETTAGVFTSILRSAGLLARPFAMQYNKTAGHDEGGEIGNSYFYDHSVMIWLNNTWYAERNYNSDEGKYYGSWASGTTGLFLLQNILSSGDSYYNDYYGDGVYAVNENWDFQNGSNGGGTVNTIWATNGPPAAEYASINRDYAWNSKKPLQIVQSPNVDVLNCPLWNGDKWAPSEWRTPSVSSPDGRTAAQTYILPAGIPIASNPLENWPFNPVPTACSPSTPTAACNAFKLSYASNTCPLLPGQVMPASHTSDNPKFKAFLPFTIKGSSTLGSVTLGNIIDNFGLDTDGDGRFDKLVVKVEVTSSQAGKYNFDGWLTIGDKSVRADVNSISLTKGTQIVQVTFDGQQIGDSKVDGPYQVSALWVAPANLPVAMMISPSKMLDYKEFTYSTFAYKANEFNVLAASIADNYAHVGIDTNGNGMVDSITISAVLNIAKPGTYSLEGDLIDSQNTFVGHASWKGSDSTASLKFEVANTIPPYTLEHLNLVDAAGAILDARYYSAYQISDMEGKIDQGNISIVPQPIANGIFSVTPTGNITFTTVDTNGNSQYDKLVANVEVTVANTLGNYRIEGLLEDENNFPVAWGISDPQTLSNGTQQMTLSFDGKMLYNQLPIGASTHSFKLVSVKIFRNNLTSSTLEASLPFGKATPAYARAQFEVDPSLPVKAFMGEDLEGGTGLTWTNTDSTLWSISTGVSHGGTKAWMASASTSKTGSITPDSSWDLSNYASPQLRFNAAYRTQSPDDYVTADVSANGVGWTTVATFTGTSANWSTQRINLSGLAKKSGVQIRFTAHALNGLLFYVDDVYLVSGPAILTADFSYPNAPDPVLVGAVTTFTASYTPNDGSLPVTYQWYVDNVLQPGLTTASVPLQFASAGNHTVKLTLQAFDSLDVVKTVSVIRSANQFNLTLNPGTGGTIGKNPDQATYSDGQVVTLTAQANPGYTFGSWTGDLSGSTNPASLTMDNNKSVGATFTQDHYNLSVSSVGQGSVARSPDQVDYTYNQQVTLTPTAVTGWSFSSWSGACSGSGACVVNMDGSKSVTATFTQDQYLLALGTVGQGSITKNPDQATYVYNQQVTLTPVTTTGWIFSSWSGACSGGGACVVTMDANKSVTATFTQNPYSLTTSVTGKGTITRSAQEPYVYNDVVQLTATPATWWEFKSWSGDLSGTTNPATLTIDGNKSVGAEFACSVASLATAINDANTSGQAVDLDGDCTFTLVGAYNPDADGYGPVGLPPITGNVTIHGNGATITRSGAAAFRLFYVTSTGHLTLDHLNLSNGLAVGGNGGNGYYDGGGGGAGLGGAIFNRGNLIINTVAFVGNIAKGGDGGNDNYPASNGGGGGGGMGGPGLNASNGNGGTGGGINGGLGGTDPSNGSNGGIGGGGGGAGTTGAYGNGGNGGFGGGGGGGNNGGAGSFGGGGGGQIGYGGSGGVSDFGGGKGGLWAGGGGGGMGGAIFNDSGTGSSLVIQDSTFDSNQAQGGNGTEGTSGSGAGGSGYGGAIFIYGGTYTATNITFINNAVVAGTSFDGRNDPGQADQPNVYDGRKYTLTVTQVTGGTIAPPTGSYQTGTVVHLTATADPTYHFVAWTGDCLGTLGLTCDVTVDAPKAVSASFAKDTFQLTVNQSAGGTITPVTASYDPGTVVNLTATANPGYQFGSWTDACLGTAGSTCSLTMNADLTVGATFIQNAFTLGVTVVGGGTVTLSPDQASYLAGETVTLTPEPALGWKFSGWSGDLTGTTNPETILMDGNKSITATFTQIVYTLTTSVIGNGTINRNNPGPYHYGDSVQLTAAADAGNGFIGWTGDVTGLVSPLTITIVGDKAITANFAALCSVDKLAYDFRVANASGGGTINLQAGCSYIVSTPAEIDAEYGPVGLPVVRTDIVLIGNGATIKLADGATFPLIVVTPDGSLTLKNVKVGSLGMIGNSSLPAVTLRNVAIGNTVTLPEIIIPGSNQ